ncbi:MAG: hypothetical protein IT259_05140 [Saprospiraceae bacterium]|nr:hypothetical protein [Saprospiraceae bacterium]
MDADFSGDDGNADDTDFGGWTRIFFRQDSQDEQDLKKNAPPAQLAPIMFIFLILSKKNIPAQRVKKSVSIRQNPRPPRSNPPPQSRDF